jgi:hypothetical protein
MDFDLAGSFLFDGFQSRCCLAGRQVSVAASLLVA